MVMLIYEEHSSEIPKLVSFKIKRKPNLCSLNRAINPSRSRYFHSQ